MIVPGPNILAKHWTEAKKQYLGFCRDLSRSTEYRYRTETNSMMDEGRIFIVQSECLVQMHPATYMKYQKALVEADIIPVPDEKEFASVLVFFALTLDAGAKVAHGTFTSGQETTNAPKKSSYTETVH